MGDTRSYPEGSSYHGSDLSVQVSDLTGIDTDNIPQLSDDTEDNIQKDVRSMDSSVPDNILPKWSGVSLPTKRPKNHTNKDSIHSVPVGRRVLSCSDGIRQQRMVPARQLSKTPVPAQEPNEQRALYDATSPNKLPPYALPSPVTSNMKENRRSFSVEASTNMSDPHVQPQSSDRHSRADFQAVAQTLLAKDNKDTEKPKKLAIITSLRPYFLASLQWMGLLGYYFYAWAIASTRMLFHTTVDVLGALCFILSIGYWPLHWTLKTALVCIGTNDANTKAQQLLLLSFICIAAYGVQTTYDTFRKAGGIPWVVVNHLSSSSTATMTANTTEASARLSEMVASTMDMYESNSLVPYIDPSAIFSPADEAVKNGDVNSSLLQQFLMGGLLLGALLLSFVLGYIRTNVSSNSARCKAQGTKKETNEGFVDGPDGNRSLESKRQDPEGCHVDDGTCVRSLRPNDIDNMAFKDLKAECDKRGIPSNSVKEDLIQELYVYEGFESPNDACHIPPTIRNMTVKQLRVALQDRGLQTTGKKCYLVNRLAKYEVHHWQQR